MKNINISLQQTQKQIASPQLQQAIKILQLSTTELAEEIEHELSENPFLEETNSNNKEENNNDNYNNNTDNQTIPELLEKNTERQREIQDDYQTNEAFFEDSSDPGYIHKTTNNTENLGKKQEFLENTLTIQTSLYDHLLSQLRFLDISDDEFYIAEILISSLNDDGYLISSVEEIAIAINKSSDLVTSILKKIQNFDPPGIAGRNLKEVLIIQLKQKKEYSKLIETLIENDLKSLEKGKFKKLSLKYNLNTEQLKKALNIITELEPIPARQFDKTETKYIVPDIIITNVQTDGKFIISTNDSIFPTIDINHNYKKLLKKEILNTKTKSYFDDKYNKAKFLIFSIEKRKETIIKVAEQLTILQKDFFQKGTKYLQPLILKDIAEKINMHESTISRVTSNKYIQTQWGIFPLKYFFSSKINSNGKIISSRSVKETIKNIIISESDKNTLSDQNITDILAKLGINIARRTVAKYRKNLKILPSFKRKD